MLEESPYPYGVRPGSVVAELVFITTTSTSTLLSFSPSHLRNTQTPEPLSPKILNYETPELPYSCRYLKFSLPIKRKPPFSEPSPPHYQIERVYVISSLPQWCDLI